MKLKNLVCCLILSITTIGFSLALPTADQVAWQDLEVGTFFHLQPETSPNPATITYSGFDANAWADAAVAEGVKYVIMVAIEVRCLFNR